MEPTQGNLRTQQLPALVLGLGLGALLVLELALEPV